MNPIKSSLVRRRRQRGAALVEGALLFPVMVMIMPYMAYFHNMHKEEFVRQAQTRSAVWDYTLRNCKAAAAGTGPGASHDTGADPGNAGAASGAPLPSNSRSSIIATGYASAQGSSDASPFKVSFAAHKFKAESWNFCNEDVNPENGILQQIWDYGKSLL